jgi:NitT/TauT family transport system ATP-binding protein/nitrate/nitrite transport system substrate-binding protein
MTRSLRIGFIPLNDCAPLAAAGALGFFADEGLAVDLLREPSWANIRDKLAAGAIDGAHMLAPMALAATLGVGSEPFAVAAPLALNRNGAAITLAASLAAGGPIAELARARRDAGEPLRLAVVFPYAIHNYLLRGWLAGQGLEPDRDVRIVTVPPPRMGEQLAAGLIDGFCAGEPWNALAAARGTGVVVARAADVAPDAPDKVLGLAAAFAAAEPEVVSALVRALVRAAAWADAPGNRGALAALLARPEHVGAPEALIAAGLRDIVFSARRPRPEDAERLLAEMRRWGQIDDSTDLGPARSVYRPDLYDAALRDRRP